MLRIGAAFSAFLFASCSFFFGTPSAGSGPTVVRVAASGSFDYEIDSGGVPRDVYFVFSASADGAPPSTSVESLSVAGAALPAPRSLPLPRGFAAASDPVLRIAESNRTALAAYGVPGDAAVAFPGETAPSFSETVGGAASFSVDSLVVSGPATCRAVANGVAVAVDATPRNLAVWVSDDEYAAQGGPVTDEMAESLASAFLKSGPDNDIYDWLTAVLGAEWGSTPYSNLIPFTGDIHILLADIEGDDSPSGGIVGFFDATNNFTAETVAASNEKIMFVIDSVMFSNRRDSSGGEGDGVWQPSDYWPGEVFSTLAHEFQHMIHFYQKGIVAGAGGGADAWINELCSLLAEDLLSEKIGVPGPRGVPADDPTAGSDFENGEGRLPYYNAFTYLPLASSGAAWWSDDAWKYYSIVYAFGAWAARNYGGAEFLRAVVQSPYTDRRAVEDAAAVGGTTDSSLDALIGRWAVAVMGSDRADMPLGYCLNREGWFESSAGGAAYRLGSIDFHRYQNGAGGTGPLYASGGGELAGLGASSNVYYLAATDLTGKKRFSLTVPAGVLVHAVLK